MSAAVTAAVTDGVKSLPKYLRAAATVRGLIADGTLRPGQPAPSGAALSRLTGYSTLTCRRALRTLLTDGILIPGPSRNARPRVAGAAHPPAARDLTTATSALSAGLAARRRGHGLTQPELAGLARVSVTTVGHAETGRVWQSRQFWERADAVLSAGGELLRLHDAYRQAAASRPSAEVPEALPAADGDGRQIAPAERVRLPQQANGYQRAELPPSGAGQPLPSCVMIVWGDGTVTTVRPPAAGPG
jgi:transcriptional regulator with XRE-family HTH domain